MWPDDLHYYILANLAEEIITADKADAEPLPCDRWLARSALQKAVRRGETRIALSALSALFREDPVSIWRHLVIIALEDVGVAGIDTLSQVVSAGRNKKWRTAMGGEWRIASYLVRKMAEDTHCQANCDLLMRINNDPACARMRSTALEATASELCDVLFSEQADLHQKAAAALALGGGLTDEQRHHHPNTVFEVLGQSRQSTHVIATAQAAWRLSRNPMALLLPLVWSEWKDCSKQVVLDDDLPSTNFIAGIPSYAVDQFTRSGIQTARSILTTDRELSAILTNARIHSVSRPRVVGDLIFLLEGGRLKHRAIWSVGDALRLPQRPLPGYFLLGKDFSKAYSHMVAKASQIDDIRLGHLLTANPSRVSTGA